MEEYFQMKKYRNLFKFASFIYQNNRLKIILALFFTILATVLDLYLPQVVKKIIDFGILGKNIEILFSLVIAYVLINIVSVAIDFAMGYIYSKMRNKVAVKMRISLLKHLYELSGNYYTDKKTGEVLSIVQSDIDMIERIDAELVFSIVKSLITAFISIYFMYRLQLELLICVIFFQLILVFLQRIFTKNIHTNISSIRTIYGDIASTVQEYVLNIMSIVLTKSRKLFISDYIKKERKMIRKNIITDMLYSGNISVAIIINTISSAVLYGYGGYKIIKGDLSIGALIAFQSYSAMLVGPCMNVVNANNRIQQAIVSIDRVYSLLNEKSDVENDFGSLYLKKGDIKIVEFKNIYFGYNNEDYLVLKDTTLKFERGKINAIVGESGCGKSTIVNLIYRLWEPLKGEILINGRDIKEFNIKSIRKNISVVTQNSLIFNTSIRENICLGKKVDDDIIYAICEKVGLSEFISSLNRGIDTSIGEMGVKISGGQKQRIAIARTIFNDCDVIVLDESTSALDNISQSEIVKNLMEYFKDKIVIVIAHRLSTIKDVDTIYVMRDGRVVECGTHHDLLELQGYYRKLYTE